MQTEPKYPYVEVPLSDLDGNVFALIGATQRELRRAGISSEEIRAFVSEATSGDYSHALATIAAWVETS